MKPIQSKASKQALTVSRTPCAAKPAPAVKAFSRQTRILVPVDFSKPSLRALQTAVDFATQFGGRITLVTVLEPDPFSRLAANPLAISEQELRTRVVSELTALGRKHVSKERLENVVVCSGKPFKEIVKAARVLKADLIVIATHGYTGLKRMLLGSTAERVIRFAPCPVLTVQADQKRRWPTRCGTA